MKKSWQQGIVDSALADLRRKWGGGWALVGQEVREALLAQKVLAVVAGQQTEGFADEQKARTLDSMIALATLAVQQELA